MKKRLLIAFCLLTVLAILLVPNKSKGPQYTPPFEVDEVPEIDYPETERSRDRPDLALEQEYEMTVDNAVGYVPTQRKVDAFNIISQHNKEGIATQEAIAGVEWNERGSDNIGGRTRAVMFDPNDSDAKKVWAGAIGGGLWYNNDITDPLSNWQQDQGIMASLAISTIVFDPANKQNFYMGTGLGFTSRFRGAGIWKTTNAGESWTQLASTINSDFFFVQKIQVTSQGVVLAATVTGLHRSTDGADSWTKVLDGRFGDIDIATDGTIYTTQGVNSTGAVLKSTDNGVTWTDITPIEGGTRTTLAVAPSNPSIVYVVADGGSGGEDVEYFMKSTDAGASWEDIPIPLYLNQDCTPSTDHFTRGQAFFDLSLEVHPENPDIVYAGGIDVHRSLDGGATWESISYWTGGNCKDYVHADIHEFQIRPGYPNSLLVGNDGGLDYSIDAGSATSPDFERRVNNYNTMLFYYAAMVNEIGSNVMLAGAQDNGTQRFTDPGVNSTRMVTGGDGAFCFIDPNDPNIQISSFTNNNYNFSTDGGLTFTRINTTANSGRFINPTDVDFEKGRIFAAAGNNQLGRVSNIPDNPGNFTTLNIDIGGGRISAVKVSPHTENRIFVGTPGAGGAGGKLWMIDDAQLGTPTITDITGEMDESRGNYLRSIDIGASDDELLITFSNFGASSVFTTMDGGTSWVNKEDNLPDVPVRWAIYNPSNRNQVLLGTDLGVWSTNDITATNPNWESSNDGMAQSVRVDHLLYRSSDETILAATYGRGLFTSNVFATTVKSDFKTKQIVAYVGVPVQFEDASLLHGDSWDWDFGDGGSSTLQNPSNTYTTAGTYDVTLSVASGSSSETKTGYVTVLPVVSVPYTAADGGNFEADLGHFTSRSLLNETNMWERGVPGNVLNTPFSDTTVWKTKLEEDITDLGFDHQSALYTPAYDLSGLDKDYTLSFRLSAENVFCNAPMALQTHYSVDGGVVWTTLGSSNGDAGSVNWYNRGPNTGCSIARAVFEDKMGWNDTRRDNSLTQFKLNFLAGQKNVSFRFVISVQNGWSSRGYNIDGFMIDDMEVLATAPTANFEASPLFAYEGSEVQFTYTSNGADSFLWDFGDNTTSTERDPLHIYTTAGKFTVSLTINTNGTPITETKTDYISISPERAVPYALADGGNFDVNESDFNVVGHGGTQFELGASGISGKDGTVSGVNAWVTGLDASQYADNSDSRLRSPLFNFSTQGQIYTLEFKSKFAFENEFDGFIVNYSTDRGTSWTKLNNVMEEGWYNMISDPESIFGASVPIFGGSTDGEFESFSTDVTFLIGENVVFEFAFLSDDGVVDVGMALDDFQILLSTPEPIVPDFEVQTGTGCTNQQVVFTNTSTGSIGTYAWDFGSNADPATATGEGPHTVTYDVAGLSTVSLTASNALGQSETESKTDIVLTGELHTPTFFEEDNGDRNVARLVVTEEGEAYQWFLGSAEIDGATERIYLATEIGNYFVEVTVNGCKSSSNQKQIITSSEEEDEFRNGITIYPNPVKDVLNVQVSNPNIGDLKIRIFDVTGLAILDKTVQKLTFDAEYSFYLANYKSGVYMIEISSDKARSIKRILKVD